MEMEFKELMYSRMPKDLEVLRIAAANFNRDTTNALTMCRLYLPNLPHDKAAAFLEWLAKQPVR